NVQVQAWGYYSATFAQQTVLANAHSVADFALRPLPKATLNGYVRSGGVPVAHALIYAEKMPQTSTYSNTDGGYTLALPVGMQTLVVRTTGQRVLHEGLSLDASGLTY